MSIVVRPGRGVPVEELPVEIVERKGRGHPDSLCDRAAEELSIRLSQLYLERFGRILHHNVDKCVLVGGQSRADFGGGEVLEPLYLLLVGRAALAVKQGSRTVEVDAASLAREGTRAWIPEAVRFLDPERHLVVDSRIRPGSRDLVQVFDADSEVPRANDTSFGVGYAPLSDTERAVLETERFLNGPEMKRKHPALGEDIKVMGVRRGDAIGLTVACAIVSRHVKNKEEYLAMKAAVEEAVGRRASKLTGREVRVRMNTADRPEENSFYLTVTGTSAEHGDDGQVGRGNRANGLITPYRPMTLEASAGKNPVTHVGKTYNVAARLIAERLVEAEPALKQVHVTMVSRIGAPICEPQAVDVEVHGGSPKLHRTAEEVAASVLDEMEGLWRGFLERKYMVF